MSDKNYDFLKKLTIYYLPGLSVFYTTLANIWSLPYLEAFVETIAALEALIGVCLAATCKKYKRKIEEEES